MKLNLANELTELLRAIEPAVGNGYKDKSFVLTSTLKGEVELLEFVCGSDYECVGEFREAMQNLYITYAPRTKNPERVLSWEPTSLGKARLCRRPDGSYVRRYKALDGSLFATPLLAVRHEQACAFFADQYYSGDHDVSAVVFLRILQLNNKASQELLTGED